MARVLDVWPHVAVVLTLFVSIVTSGYVVLYKRDSRSAVIWVAFIWLAPIIGSIAYLAFGVNRVRLRARALRGRSTWYQPVPPTISCAPEHSGEILPRELDSLKTLAEFTGKVGEKPLVPGNHLDILVNGDEAYPEMLEAIRAARRTISFCTYIFDNDAVGKKFADALGRAVARGVQVRVLIDDAGARYSWPSIAKLLRDLNVPTVRFMPTLAPWRLMTMNLRTHRKIMVVDGTVGFTGGGEHSAGAYFTRTCEAACAGFAFQGDGTGGEAVAGGICR